MATLKPTAPAVPSAPNATPPAADTGAGTSANADLLNQLTGDGTSETSPPAAAPAHTAATQTLAVPGAATVTVTPAPVAVPQHSPKLITKVDEHGQEQSLPQAAWDALGPVNLAKFTDVPTQPALPPSLI